MEKAMAFKVVSHRQEVIDAKDEAVKRAMIQIGMAAETYAKSLCPVGTPESTGIKGYIGGTLRGSITYATEEQHSTGQAPARGADYKMLATPEKERVYIGTNVEYAPYVEMGTVKMKPKPYLKPAIANNADEYKSIIERELKG
jgi:HK97 gp10 family phage protein